VCSRGTGRDDAVSIAVQLPSHRERRNRLPGSACELVEPSGKE